MREREKTRERERERERTRERARESERASERGERDLCECLSGPQQGLERESTIEREE